MRQLRAIIVGAGGMGRAWGRNVKAIADQVEVVGWVDLRDGVAAQAADEIDLKLSYAGADFTKAIADLRPDFVVDVTVPEAHHDVTIESLRAGIPVLGEKPMASSMDQAREMVRASEESGKLYMVSQSRRYDSMLTSYRNLIDLHLGRLGILNSDFYIGAHFGGFRDEMRSPLILDMAIHTFDMARYLCGVDAVSVYCEEYNPPWSWYAGDASATALFEMEGGIRYTYRGSWCAEGLDTSWQADWRAVGEHGSAVWNGEPDRLPRAQIVAGDAGFRRPMSDLTATAGDAPGGIAGSIQDFIRALITGSVPMGECHDNIKSLAMVFAAMESSDRRCRVPVRGL